MTREIDALARAIARLYEAGDGVDREGARAAFVELRDHLARGTVRAAEPDPASPTGWRVNTWVKQGILLGFRCGRLVEHGLGPGGQRFLDKDTMPLKVFGPDAEVRLAPGGSAIREGAFIGRGVICMPPAYVNIGAYVGDGTLVDSHVLVGSCAQIGRRVHLSAGAQIGGVLEPAHAVPVIVEDEVMVGGNCGMYEGVIVQARAVIGAGTVVTGSTPIYDLVHARILAPSSGMPLVVPAGAVVVPGARAVTREPGRSWGLSIATPVIVKYRDARTDARTELEAWIR